MMISDGHIILRGWCESFEDSAAPERGQCENQHISHCPLNRKSMHDEGDKQKCKKDNKITLWFEVEDTGCGKPFFLMVSEQDLPLAQTGLLNQYMHLSGIDPSKWESVFESFEQADPSTTRK